jgi:hypothetical protein
MWNTDSPETNPIRMQNTTPASEEAERVVQAVLEEQFYIWPQMDVVDENVRARFENVMARRNPVPRAMR